MLESGKKQITVRAAGMVMQEIDGALDTAEATSAGTRQWRRWVAILAGLAALGVCVGLNTHKRLSEASYVVDRIPSDELGPWILTGWPATHKREPILIGDPHWSWSGVGINLWFTIAYVCGVYAAAEWWLSGRPLGAHGWPTLRGKIPARAIQIRLSTLLSLMLIAAILLGGNLIPRWERGEGARGDFIRGFGWPMIAYVEVYHQDSKPNSHLFQNTSVATNAGFALGALLFWATAWEAGALRRELRRGKKKR